MMFLFSKFDFLRRPIWFAGIVFHHLVEEKKPLSTSCLLSLDFTGEDEILEFAFPYDVAGKTCLSLFDGPEELAFLSQSLKHRDVGFMCCIRDTEHPMIEPHFCGIDVPGQRC